MQAACFYPLTARSQAEMRSWTTAQGKNHRRAARGIPPLMVRGFANRVKRRSRFQRQRAPEKARACPVTQARVPIRASIRGVSGRGPELRRQRLANVRQKPWMRSAAFGIVAASLFQAQFAIHRQSNLGGIAVFLAIVFPPADRAQRHRSGRLQRFAPATGTAKASFHGFPHVVMDGNRGSWITWKASNELYGRQGTSYMESKKQGFPLIWRTAMRSRVERIFCGWGALV
jgi:hypothetical protein